MAIEAVPALREELVVGGGRGVHHRFANFLVVQLLFFDLLLRPEF
jgi:hypothetical protein